MEVKTMGWLKGKTEKQLRFLAREFADRLKAIADAPPPQNRFYDVVESLMQVLSKLGTAPTKVYTRALLAKGGWTSSRPSYNNAHLHSTRTLAKDFHTFVHTWIPRYTEPGER